MQLHRSIEADGVLTPLLVRQMSADSEIYQILSGYRRNSVCEKLGIKTVPVTIIECDDDRAVIIVTTSNIQRRHISLLLLVGEQKRNSDKQVRLSLRAGEHISKLTPEQQEKIEKILQDNPEVVISIKAAD